MANEIEPGHELTATQLDAQRARNLLDRALGMSERNDIAGALVTCRQSLALAPHSPQGWSMLGLLSERDGDIDGAIEAYEKALQLSPSSVYERESLQRLRHKRGSAPRPAPKFNFEEIRTEQPQAAAAQTPVIPQQAPAAVTPAPLVAETSNSFWDTFYFRSLPVLIAAVLCLGIILTAQRVAANRQMANATASVAPANSSAIVNTSTANTTTQPAAPLITPDTLAPPETTQPQPAPAAPPGDAASAQDQSAPPPEPASKPKPAPKPKPQPKATPKQPVPQEMPVLPRPRITLPNRTAPANTTPNNSTNDNPANQAPAVGGGPVDVGDSDNSKYIPVAPPRFPNASRD